ncbi:MAG: hypothetical protein IPL84_17530 [Chitinophagaceae bacterium]|nr:hypothetical protein [Chitinophagaceae bacterium]
MKLFSFVALSCFLIFVSCNEATTPVAQPDRPQAADADAIKKAVADAYSAICFKPGEQPDYEHIKQCFIPEATLINFGEDSMQVLGINQFIDYYKAFIDSNKISLFYEEEIQGNTDQFGRIAQRISSYKTYINSMDSVAQRGVNSFQTVKTAQGWKVSSIIWDIETPALTIPGGYLNSTIKTDEK